MLRLRDDQTLPELLALHAAERPRRAALVAASAYGPLTRLDYGELHALTGRVAAGLAECGIGKGDRVALLFDNSAGIEAVATMYGVHAIGGVNSPINARYTPREMTALINHSGARAIAGTDALIEHLQPVLDDMPGVSVLVSAGPAAKSGRVLDWQALVSRQSGPAPEVALHPGDHADWLYTSGTTGAPKCVMSSHRGCVGTGTVLAACMESSLESVVMTPFPFYSSSGCHSTVLMPLALGGTCVMEPTVDVASIARRIEAERAQTFGAVPSVFAFLLDSGWLERVDLSSLESVYTGGASFDPGLLARLLAVLPAHTKLFNVYGQTETGNNGMVIELTSEAEYVKSIGRRAMPWGDFKVVDDDGAPVAPGNIGEICLRGPAVMLGYLNAEEATRETLRDGWVHTGDIGRVDEDGYVYLFDRRKDVIIRGGFNISSLEVEETLQAHPGVAAAAAVAKPHDRLGEEVRAFVVRRPDATVSVEELVAFCGERLADFKVPREILFVDELPYNATGKLQKSLLRDGSWDGHVVR